MRPSHLSFLPRVVALVSIMLFGGACAGPGVEKIPEPAGPPARVVAIGDLHGDLEAARAALRLAGAIDEQDLWIGGELVVVQTGDILDRGDQEEAIMDLFQRLRVEAGQAGGAVHFLNGNHELMNVYLDFRYVTEGGFADFEGAVDTGPDVVEPTVVEPTDSVLASLEPAQRPRAAAFRPGGPIARLLAERTLSVIVGTSLFVHGGILPEHVDLGLDSMDAEVKAWLLDEAPQPEWIRGDRSPVWTRLYSSEPDMAACDTLSLVLDRLGVERMVVGHSVKSTGITSYCGGQVWCIDVGMAAHYGGRPEVLEIRGDRVRGLRRR